MAEHFDNMLVPKFNAFTVESGEMNHLNCWDEGLLFNLSPTGGQSTRESTLLLKEKDKGDRLCITETLQQAAWIRLI